MQRFEENAYYVLGLRPGATPIEVERAGAKLVAMLGVGMAAALHFRTPLGEHERTPEAVRLAMSVLRDPRQAREHAFWAALDPATTVEEDPCQGIANALELAGFRL